MWLLYVVNLIVSLPFCRALVRLVTPSPPVSVRVCACNKCTTKPEQESPTALIPNSQTKWVLGLLGGISVTGCKRGASDTLWGTPSITATLLGKTGLLRAGRNTIGLITEIRNGMILSAPKVARFWLWLRMHPPC